MSAALAVVGGGSWGTALARHAALAGLPVSLWIHDPDLCAAVRSERVNTTYLPGHPIPESLLVSSEIGEVVAGAGAVLLVVPSHHLRAVTRSLAAHVRENAPVLVATKGLEEETLLRMSQVVAQEAGIAPARVATLSGPSFAREVADGHPTTVVVASEDERLGERFQAQLSARNLRIYTNRDQVGVELGGALKNVVAVAAGILEGLGHGTNTAAALLTRGLHEVTRLAVTMGGQRATMAGLAGMGDLVLTCTGKLSRNRAVGVELGRGRPLAEILSGMKMVAEGVRTTRAAAALARRVEVEMPITERVNSILFEAMPPGEALQDLLSRTLKDETVL